MPVGSTSTDGPAQLASDGDHLQSCPSRPASRIFPPRQPAPGPAGYFRARVLLKGQVLKLKPQRDRMDSSSAQRNRIKPSRHKVSPMVQYHCTVI